MQPVDLDDSLIIDIGKDHILPEGNYMFIEYYCNEADCDCKSGIFQLTKLDSAGRETTNIIALIDYTWAHPIADDNPCLDPQYISSPLAEAGLEEFKKMLVDDIDIISKLQDGYDRTKQVAAARRAMCSQVKTLKSANKIGRNDPCSCGSGKKYKKCCLLT